MPVVVGLAGPAAATMSHDVAEKQVLTGMDGEAQAYWLHLLMLRLDNARWVTVDPNMDMAVEDLSGEELIPVARGMPLPLMTSQHCSMGRHLAPAETVQSNGPTSVSTPLTIQGSS